MRKNNGFTLMELLVILAIMSIILAVAVTALGKARYNWTLRGEANQFIMSVYKARGLAMKEEKIVKIHFDNPSSPRAYSLQVKQSTGYVSVPSTTHNLADQAIVTVSPAKDIVFYPDGRMFVEQATNNYVLSFIKVYVAQKTIPNHYIKIVLYPLGGIETSRHFVK